MVIAYIMVVHLGVWYALLIGHMQAIHDATELRRPVTMWHIVFGLAQTVNMLLTMLAITLANGDS